MKVAEEKSVVGTEEISCGCKKLCIYAQRILTLTEDR